MSIPPKEGIFTFSFDTPIATGVDPIISTDHIGLKKVSRPEAFSVCAMADVFLRSLPSHEPLSFGVDGRGAKREVDRFVKTVFKPFLRTLFSEQINGLFSDLIVASVPERFWFSSF